MKTIIITAHQLNNGMNTTISLPVTLDNDANFNMVAGTALNRLFEWTTLLKKHNVKGAVKSSIPLDLRFEVMRNPDEDNETSILFDTATIGALHPSIAGSMEMYRSGMKLGNTAKSKRRFAAKFMDLFRFATSDIKIVDFAAFMADLMADEITENAAAKEKKEYNTWLEMAAPFSAN